MCPPAKCPGIAGVGLRQIRGIFHALGVHRVAGVAEFLRHSHHALAEEFHLPGADFLDDIVRGLEIAVAHSVGDFFVGMPAVVFHRIRQRGADGNGIHAHLVHQFDQDAGLIDIEDADVGGQEIQRLEIELGPVFVRPGF